MVKALPPLAWFRAFEVAARRLSFTAAAQEIGMTQSAVSQHVKSLESRLGVQLFLRQPRGLSLTDEGRKLLPQVGAALETLATAARSFETGTAQNVLTVATSVSLAQWVIAPDLASFTAQMPNVSLRFLSTIWPDDFQSINAYVEIPFGSESQVGQDAVLLQPNRLVALKSPALSGALEDLPLIESVGTSGGWRSWQKAIGPTADPTIFVDSYGAALNMAATGNGVALVSELLAGHALRSGQLVHAHAARVACKEGYFLRINETEPAALAFRDWLMDRLSLVG